MNIYSDGFGDFNNDIVEKLLQFTAYKLEEYSGITSPRDFVIKYRSSNPMCSNYGNKRIIYLHVNGDYWGQWVYQFAHEYCHHLIDMEMSSKKCGLFWFEETLCELASRFIIALLADPQTCNSWGLKRANYVLSYYHQNCLPVDSNLSLIFDQNGSIAPWLQLLSEPVYHREHYDVIAQKLLPLFLEYPYLWRIIGRIGNSSYYFSLEEFLNHIGTIKELNLSYHLFKMRNILLPY